LVLLFFCNIILIAGPTEAELELIQKLQSKKWKVAMKAAEKLGEIRSASELSQLALVKALSYGTDTRRWRQTSKDVMVMASNALRKIKPTNEKVLLKLVETLTEYSDASAFYASEVLIDIELKNQKIIFEIVELLVFPGRMMLTGAYGFDVAEVAAYTIAGIKSLNETILLQLVASLSLHHENDKNARRAKYSAMAFSKMSNINEAISLKLVELLHSDDWQVVKLAVKALERTDPSNKKIIFEIAQTLQHDKWEVTEAAVKALGEIKPTDEKILLKIVDTLWHTESKVTTAALETLEKIKIEPTYMEIINKLTATFEPSYVSYNDQLIVNMALTVLAKIKPTDEATLLKFVEVIHKKDESVVTEVQRALVKIKPTNENVRLRLIANLDNEDPDMVTRTIDWLGDLYPTDDSVLLKIVESLRYENWSLSRVALNALKGAKLTNTKVLLALVEYLQDDHWKKSDAALAEIYLLSPEERPRFLIKLPKIDKGVLDRSSIQYTNDWHLSEKIVKLLFAIELKNPIIVRKLSEISQTNTLKGRWHAEKLLNKNRSLFAKISCHLLKIVGRK